MKNEFKKGVAAGMLAVMAGVGGGCSAESTPRAIEQSTVAPEDYDARAEKCGEQAAKIIIEGVVKIADTTQEISDAKKLMVTEGDNAGSEVTFGDNGSVDFTGVSGFNGVTISKVTGEGILNGGESSVVDITRGMELNEDDLTAYVISPAGNGMISLGGIGNAQQGENFCEITETVIDGFPQ